MSPVRIFGVGSPFGEDRIGWQAIEALNRSGILRGFPPGWVSLSCLDRPGARLIEDMNGALAVILIDAMRSGAPPGSLRRLDLDRLEAWGASLSSHGMGVAGALGLACALGQLPERLVILGIEIGEPQAHPQPRVCHAALTRLVTEELERIRCGGIDLGADLV